jgi:hypothetical protein
MKKRILVCGGREYNDYDKFKEVMNNILPWFDPEFCIIQGGARGADRLAMGWAFFQGCPMIEMRANWDYYRNHAGVIRNTWMIKYAMPDLVVAFPGGTGTANMIKQARAASIDVFEVK